MIFSSLLEAVPLPGLLITGENRILCANSAALLLFGNNVVGLAYISVLRHPAVLKAIEVTLGGQSEAKTRYTAALGDQDVTYDMTCRRVKIAKNNLILVCFRDVTDVEQATQMRRDFVANVSHELRTPLTALSGFIETLQGPAREDAAARKRFLDIMAKEAARMNRLVDDLLSLSRVESDERMRPIEQVELNGLLQSCIITMAASAKSEKVDMTLLGDENSEYFIQGDEDQLRQVFNNLLENAIKYG
ncbi:MAG: two-component sensor histidine kinase, partial [Rhodobacteraceae bacterium]|nr:two-component sensor histidine kinase [Paracoccaceae bacterium]